MNDARESEEVVRMDFDSFRAGAKKETVSAKPKGVITAETAAARQKWLGENQAGRLEEAAMPIETVPAPESPAADPATNLRHLRLGIAAVVVLVLLLFWIRQRSGR